MDKDRLGDAWVTTVLACVGGAPLAGDTAKLRTLMRAMAADTIKEFIDNAEVTDIITSTPGATAGPNTLPGTGVGSVTA